MLIRLLRSQLGPYKRILLIVMGLQLVQTIAALQLPGLNADIIDRGVLHRNIAGKIEPDHAAIWHIGLVMVGISFVQVAFNVGAIYFGAKAAAGFGRDVRGRLFHQVTGFSTQEVNRLGAPSLITRITNDVQQVQMLVLTLCTLFVSAPIMAVGGIVMALRDDVSLSTVLIVAVIVLLVGIGIVVTRMVPYFRSMQERIDGINGILREQITGIRVVRAFVREPDEAKRFGVANDEVTEISLRAGRLMAMIFPIVTITINCSSVAVLWFGAGRVSTGKLQIGALIAFLSYLALVLTAVTMATFMTTMIPRAAVCAERIMEVLDTDSTVVEAAGAVGAVTERAVLEMRGVEFSYPGAESPVLRDISFRVAPGTTTAIIGSTGAGKTSLLNLVPRLFDATDGVVTIDGVDVRDLTLDALWSRVGLVPQRPYLFSGTVASNLRYGKGDATDDELWEALEIAQARDFVAAMPGGLDSSITQGGSNVSGGQRQRLAIARALVRKPEVYLFDDSFSALDLATDARLRAALEPWTRDAAMVIVAQRVSTIRRADQIIVLEDGEIVGLGTHEELLVSCTTYGEIVASQFTEEATA